jgi:phage terminase large subunit
VVPRQAVEDGINAVRNLLPRCRFDRARTTRGLEALRQYRRDWDESLGTFRARPRHDWASHAADAFRYLALGLRPEARGAERPPARAFDPLTYGLRAAE